jgi:hypothetical protein
MKNAIVLLVHLLARLAILLGTGGTRVVLAENMLLTRLLQSGRCLKINSAGMLDFSCT